MSDTPRTDDVFNKEMNLQLNGFITLCRQLERELNAANAELDKFEENFEEYKRKYSIEDCV